MEPGPIENQGHHLSAQPSETDWSREEFVDTNPIGLNQALEDAVTSRNALEGLDKAGKTRSPYKAIEPRFRARRRAGTGQMDVLAYTK